jgi:glycosyltransferase involved in cell wall biosynthesis
MIVPRSRELKHASDTPEKNLCGFYNVKGGFRLRLYPGLPRLPLEVERVVHAAIAGIKYTKYYDIVHTRSRGVLILSILKRQPVIFETYRNLQKTAPVFSRLLRLLSRSKFFLGAICHSSLSAQSLQAIGVAKEKTVVIYNGFDPSLLKPELSQKKARTMLNLPIEQKTVVYAGNVQRTKGISVLLDLAKSLSDVQFLIVGGKEQHLKAIRKEIAERKIGNVVLAGWKNQIELAPHLYAADVLIIPPTAGPLEKFGRTVLPMKTFLFLGVGRAIIAPSTPDLCEILTDNIDALLPQPDNLKAAETAICRVLDNPELARCLGQAARKKSRDFSWRKRAEKISTLYRTWLERKL